MRFHFDSMWADGFIPIAIMWGKAGIGICIMSFAIGVSWEQVRKRR